MSNKLTNITPSEIAIISLYCNDYLKELHGREIARQLSANHRTTILALKKLEEKNILHSKTIGKNKMFILNIKNITTREYLRYAEITKTISLTENHFFIKKLLQDLDPCLGHIPIILFGSYAKGTEKKESDLDLVIAKDPNQYNHSLEKKIKEFTKQYGVKIQIQKGTREDFEKGLKEKDPLVLEVIKNHIILNNYEFWIGMLWRFAHERWP